MGKGSNGTLKCLTQVTRWNVVLNMIPDIRIEKQQKEKK